jgi:hypothetical protein
VARLKWKLNSDRSKIVLILTQDRCTVCVKSTIAMKLQGDVGHVNLVLVHLEIVLESVQDRCTVCAKHTVGSEIVLDTPDDTPW